MSHRTKGFTIVELAVVIVVIGILAGLVAFGWNGWQRRAAESEIKSDLSAVVTAMKSSKNFNNGYPALAAGSTFDSNGPSQNQALFKSSSGVTMTYYAGDAGTFCVEAVSKRIPTLGYFIDMSPTNGNGAVQAGTCSGEPIQPPITSGYYAVANTGAYHTCAIAYNNNAYCWGDNSTGQLGNSSTTNSSVRVAVSSSGVLSGKTIKSVTTGLTHSCALASDNNAYCWGYGNFGQLGDTSTTNTTVPVAVSTIGALSGKTVKSISAGDYHTCAIASDNNTYCWGMGGSGRLGTGSSSNTSTPAAVSTVGVLSGKTIKSIRAGQGHTCAIASDNNAYCWGLNSSGQLGNNSTTSSNIPVAVTTSGLLAGKTIKSINPGLTHTCAVASDDNAYCWGEGANGMLGNNASTNSSIPVAVSTSGVLSGKTIKSITAGHGHTCAVGSDNNTYCWGMGASGRLGNNSTASSLVPVQANNP